MRLDCRSDVHSQSSGTIEPNLLHDLPSYTNLLFGRPLDLLPALSILPLMHSLSLLCKCTISVRPPWISNMKAFPLMRSPLIPSILVAAKDRLNIFISASLLSFATGANRLERYLCPLVILCVVGLHGAQVGLAVVSTHSVEPVAQQANTHSIPGDAQGGHSGPRVGLWVVPAITIRRLFIHSKRRVMKGGEIFHPISPARQEGNTETSVCERRLIALCFQHLSEQTEN